MLGKPIGKQDQYAGAVGEFLPRGGVRVEPIICPVETFKRLQRSLLLFYTGHERSAAEIPNEQRDAIQNGGALEGLKKKMRSLALELREPLGAGDVDALGVLLRENWELKRALVDGISDQTVDEWYHRALDAGATGGKILGAGAGGFLLRDSGAAGRPVNSTRSPVQGTSLTMSTGTVLLVVTSACAVAALASTPNVAIVSSAGGRRMIYRGRV